MINWLLQRSDSGATYLQIIILLIIVFFIINILNKTIHEIIDIIKGDSDVYEDKENDSKKM